GRLVTITSGHVPLPSRTMSPVRPHGRRAALLCALAALVAPLAAHGSVARTGDTAPCWKLLLNDWYDGTINKIYPIPCYQRGISLRPADLRISGSARGDILAARASAIRHESAPPEHGGTGASTTTTTTEVVSTNGTTTTTTTVLVVPVQTTTTKKSTPFLDR